MVAKTLILTYWNYIDRGIKRRLIDAVVQSINDWLASLATDEKIIGGRVEFNESENSTSQLAAGIVRFHHLYDAAITNAENGLCA